MFLDLKIYADYLSSVIYHIYIIVKRNILYDVNPLKFVQAFFKNKVSGQFLLVCFLCLEKKCLICVSWDNYLYMSTRLILFPCQLIDLLCELLDYTFNNDYKFSIFLTQ